MVYHTVVSVSNRRDSCRDRSQKLLPVRLSGSQLIRAIGHLWDPGSLPDIASHPNHLTVTVCHNGTTQDLGKRLRLYRFCRILSF